MSFFANDYAEIPAALAQNREISRRMISLIQTEPIAGKATEGDGRVDALREILRELTLGSITEHRAIRRVHDEIPRHSSRYQSNNRVFPKDWDERLIRTQFSRFYNQAVLEMLIERGDERCFVPHSRAEAADSPCSVALAGKTHSVRELLELLVESYSKGNWAKTAETPKIPDHPHCTHVAVPT